MSSISTKTLKAWAKVGQSISVPGSISVVLSQDGLLLHGRAHRGVWDIAIDGIVPWIDVERSSLSVVSRMSDIERGLRAAYEQHIKEEKEGG